MSRSEPCDGLRTVEGDNAYLLDLKDDYGNAFVDDIPAETP
jgi:hypothetical protein